jgi:N-acetyl-gamma-glutamyl-phosphate reductase
VYGLPELNREAIRDARLIANPGCYPTTIQLGFYPLLKAGVIDATHLIADAKSGVSGAGRKAEIGTLFSEASDNFKAYGVSGHRHTPETSAQLQRYTSQKVRLIFTPHLVPMIRGMHSTLYARLTSDIDNAVLQALFEDAYEGSAFVDVMPFGTHPETRSTRGSNMLRLAVHRPDGDDTVVVLVVQDNLVKGASGQAVQCMNLMFGLPETTGLQQIALLP